MQDEINRLKRKLNDIEQPVVAQVVSQLDTNKGYTKGRRKMPEKELLEKLNNYTTVLKEDELGKHVFKDGDSDQA